MKEIKCSNCGRLFISYNNKLVCSNACAKERKLAIQKKYRDSHKETARQYDEYQKRLNEISLRSVRRQPRNLRSQREIEQMFREASQNDLGLSYGYYVGFRDTGYLEEYRRIKEREKNENMR